MKAPAIEAKLLGQKVNYPQSYSPGILVAVPRKINREEYGLNPGSLPFCGEDVWHCYEFSFLTLNGLPVTGVLKIVYSAQTEFLVESKSLKLYLNSFNMERYGSTRDEGIDLILKTINLDLGSLLKTKIEIKFFNQNSILKPVGFSDYEIIENRKDVELVKFENFNETPSLLINSDNKCNELKTGTHLLRSNCKITNQPDWGSAFIYIKGPVVPSYSSLLKYIVSIRNENHFHEEICEMIFKRIWDIFNPDELMVTCIYTRRGGIDICPVRVSHNHLLPKNLVNPNVLTEKLLRQ